MHLKEYSLLSRMLNLDELSGLASLLGMLLGAEMTSSVMILVGQSGPADCLSTQCF